MLVLTRKVGQKVTIEHNGEIIGTITICDTRGFGNSVSLGFEFPDYMRIRRTETLPPPAAEAATEPPFGLGLPSELWDSDRQA